MNEYSILEAENGGHYVMAKCEGCLPFLGPVFRNPGEAVLQASQLFKDFTPYQRFVVDDKVKKPFEEKVLFPCDSIKADMVPESDILLAMALAKLNLPGASFGKCMYNKHVCIVFSAEGLFSVVTIIAFDGTYKRVDLPEVIVEETMLREATLLGNPNNRELIQSFIKSL